MNALRGYLFNEIPAQPSTNDEYFSRIMGVFNGVQNYNHNNQYVSPPPSDEVVIYCDYSRFKENKDCNGEDKKGYACDPDIQDVVQMDSDYQGCKGSLNTDTTQVRDLPSYELQH